MCQVPGQEEQEEPLLQVHVQREGRLQGPQQQEGQEGEEGGQQEQEQIIETRGATAYWCNQCVCHFHIIILCLRYFTLIDIPLHINFLFNYTVFIRRIRSLENKHLDKISCFLKICLGQAVMKINIPVMDGMKKNKGEEESSKGKQSSDHTSVGSSRWQCVC